MARHCTWMVGQMASVNLFWLSKVKRLLEPIWSPLFGQLLWYRSDGYGMLVKERRGGRGVLLNRSELVREGVAFFLQLRDFLCHASRIVHQPVLVQAFGVRFSFTFRFLPHTRSCVECNATKKVVSFLRQFLSFFSFLLQFIRKASLLFLQSPVESNSEACSLKLSGCVYLFSPSNLVLSWREAWICFLNSFRWSWRASSAFVFSSNSPCSAFASSSASCSCSCKLSYSWRMSVGIGGGVGGMSTATREATTSFLLEVS